MQALRSTPFEYSGTCHPTLKFNLDAPIVCSQNDESTRVLVRNPWGHCLIEVMKVGRLLVVIEGRRIDIRFIQEESVRTGLVEQYIKLYAAEFLFNGVFCLLDNAFSKRLYPFGHDFKGDEDSECRLVHFMMDWF